MATPATLFAKDAEKKILVSVRFRPLEDRKVCASVSALDRETGDVAYTDDAKSLELLLLGRSIDYRSREERRASGERPGSVIALEWDWQGTSITLRVFPARDERGRGAASSASRSSERASLAVVLDLLRESSLKQ